MLIRIGTNQKKRTILYSILIFILVLGAVSAASWSSMNNSSISEIHPLKNDQNVSHKESLSIWGQDSCRVGEECQYCLSIGSAQNNCNYEGVIKWGDNQKDTSVTPNVTKANYSIKGCKLCATHVWKNEGIFYISALATKGGPLGFLSAQEKKVTISKNNPPKKPNMITGNTLVRTGQTFSYSTSTNDPENDKIKYIFRWVGKDGTSSTPTDLIDSGTTVSVNHTWENTGVYMVSAEAIDSWGLESDWSDQIRVDVKEKL
jgi:hypothetical protein